MAWVALALMLPWLLLVAVRMTFVLRAQRVVGKVVAIELGGDDNDTPGPVVEIVHPSGAVQRLPPRWYSTTYAGLKVGDPIEVLVRGDAARLNTFTDLWLFPVILASMLMIVAITLFAITRE